MPCFVCVLRNCGGLCMSKPYVSVMFFYPILHCSPCFAYIYFAAFTWNSVYNTFLFTFLFTCECGKVYIGETGRAMQDRIKEHNRDIRLAHTQTSAVLEHANETGHLPLWNQVKFIDRDPHRYTRRVKEAIQIRLHSNNINRDNGIEILEAWMPTIRKHNSRSTTKRTSEGTLSASRNNEDRNTPITVNQRA